jgi:hypothetical protein
MGRIIIAPQRRSSQAIAEKEETFVTEGWIRKSYGILHPF